MHKYNIIDFSGLDIKETRRYKHFYSDERFSKKGNYCDFDLKFNFSDKKGRLSISNAGGMIDSMPKSLIQLKWTEEKLKGLSVKDTWATEWDIYDYRSYELFNNSVMENCSKLQDMHFTVHISAFVIFIAAIYKNGYNLNGFQIVTEDNKYSTVVLDNDIYQKLGEYCLQKENSNTGRDEIRSLNNIFSVNKDNRRNMDLFYETEKVKLDYYRRRECTSLIIE